MNYWYWLVYNRSKPYVHSSIHFDLHKRFNGIIKTSGCLLVAWLQATNLTFGHQNLTILLFSACIHTFLFYSYHLSRQQICLRGISANKWQARLHIPLHLKTWKSVVTHVMLEITAQDLKLWNDSTFLKTRGDIFPPVLVSITPRCPQTQLKFPLGCFYDR